MWDVWILIIFELVIINNYNKKVLLRERKRHTACRAVSTHSVALSWLTPPWLTTPPRLDWPPQLDWPPRLDWLPPRLDWPPQLDWPTPPAGLTPPSWTDPPTPAGLTPPPRGQTEGQTCVKTLPSHHTMYAGGNKQTYLSTRKSSCRKLQEAYHLWRNLSSPRGRGAPLLARGYPSPG